MGPEASGWESLANALTIPLPLVSVVSLVRIKVYSLALFDFRNSSSSLLSIVMEPRSWLRGISNLPTKVADSVVGASSHFKFQFQKGKNIFWGRG